MSEELLPCPHCGEPATDHYHLWEWEIRCSGCRAKMTGFYSRENALATWNKRAGWQPVEHVRLPDGTELYADEIAITNGKRGVAYYTITLPEDGSVRLCRKACPFGELRASSEPAEGVQP